MKSTDQIWFGVGGITSGFRTRAGKRFLHLPGTFRRRPAVDPLESTIAPEEAILLFAEELLQLVETAGQVLPDVRLHSRNHPPSSRAGGTR
jgi:hypothetical protein